ncbi:DUF1194 domain-containing protein [Roseomonas sp. HF4]|uniref:DUF1194 domain-containing protein n=1 Tax=Roseomonas sp. HF4 TaxID=2562313 RepID=UPI0010BFE286|nr:DUF1194 domain-containing protein [Roseomonas sp. HF4]
MWRPRLLLPDARRRAGTHDSVDLLLVLAVDVSASISAEEARMQQRGYRAGLRHPLVLGAIASGPVGAIGVAAVAWAGLGFQKLVVPWRRIVGMRDAQAWGEALSTAWAPVPEEAAAEAFPNGSLTCISRAIDFSRDVLARAPWDAPRRVIDVSGDGPNNEGPPVEEARDRAVAEGTTINGLTIEGDPELARMFGAGARLADYYRDAVIGGPSAFVVVAEDIRAFGDAVRRKLILEIADGHGAEGRAL